MRSRITHFNSIKMKWRFLSYKPREREREREQNFQRRWRSADHFLVWRETPMPVWRIYAAVVPVVSSSGECVSSLVDSRAICTRKERTITRWNGGKHTTAASASARYRLNRSILTLWRPTRGPASLHALICPSPSRRSTVGATSQGQPGGGSKGCMYIPRVLETFRSKHRKFARRNLRAKDIPIYKVFESLVKWKAINSGYASVRH